MEKQLHEIWQKSGYPAAQKLYQIAKAKGVAVTGSQVKKFIENQSTAQLHKQAPRNVVATPITVDGKNTEYQLDLTDMTPYSRQNGGKKWIVLLENVWSRQAAAVPCATKSPSDVVHALQLAIKRLGGNPVQIVSDSGSEWLGAVKTFFSQQGINHRTVEVADHHALGLIDRLTKTIKSSLEKHFTHTQKTEWVDYLLTLVESYNNSPHSTLKLKGEPAMSPNESQDNESDTRVIHLAAKDKSDDKKKLKTDNLAAGDFVRVLKRKEVFQKGFSIRYSIKVYKIVKADGLWFELDNGKRYREGDLQRVPEPKAKATEVEQKDVAASARKERKDEVILQQDGIEQGNRRSGLRERAPASQLEDKMYGRIRW